MAMEIPKRLKHGRDRGGTLIEQNTTAYDPFNSSSPSRSDSIAGSFISDTTDRFADDNDESTVNGSPIPNSKMPPAGRRPITPKREIDLSFLLNATQRTDLITLSDTIFDTLEQQLAEPYSLLDTAIGRKQKRVSTWTYKVVKTRNAGSVADEVQDDNASVLPLPCEEEVVVDIGKAKHDVPNMSELHKEVLANFKKWQLSLAKRLNEITVSNPPTGPRRNQVPGHTRVGVPLPQSQQQPAPRPPAKDDYPRDPALIKYYPPTQTPLVAIPVDKRRLLLHSIVLIVVSLEHYNWYSRAFLLHLSSSFHIPARILLADEKRVAQILFKVLKTIPEPEVIEQKLEKPQSESTLEPQPDQSNAAPQVIDIDSKLDFKSEPKSEQRPPLRKIRTQPVVVRFVGDLVTAGLGSVTDGTRLGMSVVAALLGPIADCHAALGAVFSVYFNKPVSKCLDALGLAGSEVALVPLHHQQSCEPYQKAQSYPVEGRSMRMVICINGMQSSEENIAEPWAALGQQSEVFVLRWEAEALAKLTQAFATLVGSMAWSQSRKDLNSRAVSKTLVDKLWPTSVLKVCKIVDNHWCGLFAKADKAGTALADALLNKVHGERGVSLIGFGFGARVIYTCLLSLSERRAYGLVDSAVLMGTPCPADAATWSGMKSVVGGRLVNVYSEADTTLAFAHRVGCFQYGVAGLQSIDGVCTIENHDVSKTVTTYAQYGAATTDILVDLEWDDLPLQIPIGLKQSTASIPESKVEPVLASRENRQQQPPPRGGGKGVRPGGPSSRNNQSR